MAPGPDRAPVIPPHPERESLLSENASRHGHRFAPRVAEGAFVVVDFGDVVATSMRVFRFFAAVSSRIYSRRARASSVRANNRVARLPCMTRVYCFLNRQGAASKPTGLFKDNALVVVCSGQTVPEQVHRTTSGCPFPAAPGASSSTPMRGRIARRRDIVARTGCTCPTVSLACGTALSKLFSSASAGKLRLLCQARHVREARRPRHTRARALLCLPMEGTCRCSTSPWCLRRTPRRDRTASEYFVFALNCSAPPA